MKRRNFLKNIGGTAAALSVPARVFTQETRLLQPDIRISSNDKVRLGLIGAGIIGHYDTDTALRVPGTELVAACDLYDGRLEYAREKWGASLMTTRDYRELLARPDIDAVLVCTPDHWHARIAIDAMLAGKHVYCEKPMVQRIKDGYKVIETQQKTGKVFQVGSQRASSIAMQEAKKQLAKGTIGQLVTVEATYDRTDTRGAWNYSIPLDASPETCDWDRFLGYAPKRPFDKTRFFRWRNYKDYGTGVAGDLFVHLLTGLHVMTSSLGPTRIFALGDLNYWKDGRDANDIINAVFNYPETAQHPSFHLVTRSNLADGLGGKSLFRMIGTEGYIDMGWNNFTVKNFKRPVEPGYGGYDSYESFSAKQKAEFKKWYEAQYGTGKEYVGIQWGEEIKYEPPANYDDRYEHMVNFFESIRSGKPCVEDASFGLRAAAPSLACNMSAESGKPVYWDPQEMKVLRRGK